MVPKGVNSVDSLPGQGSLTPFETMDEMQVTMDKYFTTRSLHLQPRAPSPRQRHE